MKKLMEITIKAWEDVAGKPTIIQVSNEDGIINASELNDIEKEVIQKVLDMNVSIISMDERKELVGKEYEEKGEKEALLTVLAWQSKNEISNKEKNELIIYLLSL